MTYCTPYLFLFFIFEIWNMIIKFSRKFHCLSQVISCNKAMVTLLVQLIFNNMNIESVKQTFWSFITKVKLTCTKFTFWKYLQTLKRIFAIKPNTSYPPQIPLYVVLWTSPSPLLLSIDDLVLGYSNLSWSRVTQLLSYMFLSYGTDIDFDNASKWVEHYIY